MKTWMIIVCVFVAGLLIGGGMILTDIRRIAKEQACQDYLVTIYEDIRCFESSVDFVWNNQTVNSVVLRWNTSDSLFDDPSCYSHIFSFDPMNVNHTDEDLAQYVVDAFNLTEGKLTAFECSHLIGPNGESYYE